jgi:hypothetical protein
MWHSADGSRPIEARDAARGSSGSLNADGLKSWCCRCWRGSENSKGRTGTPQTNSSLLPSSGKKANFAGASVTKRSRRNPGVARELCANPDVTRDIYAATAAAWRRIRRQLRVQIEEQAVCRILGLFENGVRHLSNRPRPVRTPFDLAVARDGDALSGKTMRRPASPWLNKRALHNQVERAAVVGQDNDDARFLWVVARKPI